MIYICEDRKFIEKEFVRMGFDKDERWRISDINRNFELCNTYPRFLIVPSSFKDENLESVAKFRYFRRIPVAVWRHVGNGCFIVRSSQPTVGWFGWFRNEMDENLIESYVNNTMPHQSKPQEPDSDESLKHTPQQSTNVDQQNHISPDPHHDNGTQPDDSMTTNKGVQNEEDESPSTNSKMLIIDARSYTAAMANRAKGGGCECSEYYPKCEVLFTNLANIHRIRNSFQSIRSVCEAYSEQSNK